MISELTILKQLQDDLNNCNVKNFGNVNIYFQETTVVTKKSYLEETETTNKQIKYDWFIAAEWENYEYNRNSGYVVQNLYGNIVTINPSTSTTVSSLIVKAKKDIKELTGKDIELKLVNKNLLEV
jgi:hypothetical protein